MTAVSQATLRTRVRSRADMVSSTFCTDTELDYWMQEANGELHDILVLAYGHEYASASDTFTVNSSSVAVFSTLSASTLFKVLSVEIRKSGTYIPIKPFEFAGMNSNSGPYDPTNLGAEYRYRWTGTVMRFEPEGSPGLVGSTGRIWYVPQAGLVSAGVDYPNGWEQFIVVDAAMKALAKEESDTSQLAAEKMALRARIEASAINRNMGGPTRSPRRARW